MSSKIINSKKIFFEQIKSLSWIDKLIAIDKGFTGKKLFSTSFSNEDQLITYVIAKYKLNIEIFTLDTGRLFEKTYKIWNETIKKYQIKIAAYLPDIAKLEKFLNQHGSNSFYDSKDLRLNCCHIRKVIPLNRALYDKNGNKDNLWLSGLRVGHSNNRKSKDFNEYDKGRSIFKYYPILDLSDKEVTDFIEAHNIPSNSLYSEGFTSIGCEPCTRKPTDPNDPRSGRWWWENDGVKECGLHLVNGKLVRKGKKK
jgi:phosphoadenosine phosphosulfate reductase